MQRDFAPLGGAIGKVHQVADLGNFQRGAADARLAQQRSGIEQAVKIEAATLAQIAAHFFGQLLLALDPGAVPRGRELHHAIVPQRRSGVDRQQFAQLLELQNTLAAVAKRARNRHGRSMVQEKNRFAGRRQAWKTAGCDSSGFHMQQRLPHYRRSVCSR